MREDGAVRAVSLLSGGLDSVVSVALAAQEAEIVRALTFDYGQRAAAAEVRAAGLVCRELGIPHQVLHLPWLGDITAAPLVDTSAPMPQPDAIELDDAAQADSIARTVWVPNRNAVFVNIGAAFAEALECEAVVCGFNAEEGASFPDNCAGFVEAANAALRLSTRAGVWLWAPTLSLTKAGIVAAGRRIGAPLQHVWSCYEGGSEQCGCCASCLRLRRAMAGQDEAVRADARL